jgi:hypothetical protein
MKIKGSLQVSGTTEGITFTDGVTPFPRSPKLTFDIGGFYLSGDSAGRPIVNLRVGTTGVTFSDGISSYLNKSKLFFNTNNFYLSGDSSGQPVVNQRNPVIKGINLEFPGSSENAFIFRAHEIMRLLSARAVLVGSASPSVTFSIKSGSDRSSLGTTHTTSTAVTNTTTGTLLDISTPTIPAGSWVCLVSTAQGGTVTEIDLSLQLEFV